MSVYNNLCPSTSNTWNASSLCATRSQKMASLQTLSLECSLATPLPLLSLVLPFCRSCPCDVQTQPPTAKSKWLHPSSTSLASRASQLHPATSHLWFANPRHVSHWLVYVASKTWCTLKACQTYQRNSTPIEQWNVVKLASLPWHCYPDACLSSLLPAQHIPRFRSKFASFSTKTYNSGRPWAFAPTLSDSHCQLHEFEGTSLILGARHQAVSSLSHIAIDLKRITFSLHSRICCSQVTSGWA